MSARTPEEERLHELLMVLTDELGEAPLLSARHDILALTLLRLTKCIGGLVRTGEMISLAETMLQRAGFVGLGAEVERPRFYRADWQVEDGTTHWRPSIHMPRWASRLTLDITGLRVERLQEISEADAQAEGITPTMGGGYWEGYDRDPDGARGTHCSCLSPEVEPPEWMLEPFWRAPYTLISARDHFAGLWVETYGAKSWAENPWVWVVTFKAVPRG